MGVYGVYTAVDDETFKQISFLNKEKLPVQIAELEKKDDVPSCDLGKLVGWVALPTHRHQDTRCR